MLKLVLEKRKLFLSTKCHLKKKQKYFKSKRNEREQIQLIIDINIAKIAIVGQNSKLFLHFS